MASCLSKNEALNICLVKRFHCTKLHRQCPPPPHRPHASPLMNIAALTGWVLLHSVHPHISILARAESEQNILHCWGVAQVLQTHFILVLGLQTFQTRRAPTDLLDVEIYCWIRSIEVFHHDDMMIDELVSTSHNPPPAPLPFMPF